MRIIVITVLAAGQLLWMGPAEATIVFRDQYAEPYSFSYNDCGFTVNVEGEVSGTVSFRSGQGKLASAFFKHDNFQFSETHTNPDSGASLTIRGNGLFHEVKAVPLGGMLFRFTAIEAGQPFTIVASDGSVLRDRGVTRHSAVFDTLGDDAPGGVLVEEFEPRVAGPHPAFALTFEQFCALLD